VVVYFVFSSFPYAMHGRVQSLQRTAFTLRIRRSGLSRRFYGQASNGPSKSQEENEGPTSSRSSIPFADKLTNAGVRMREYVRKMSGNGTITLRKRADEFTASTETLFSRLGRQLNKATGYGDIEVLKHNVVKQGESFIRFYLFRLLEYIAIVMYICRG